MSQTEKKLQRLVYKRRHLLVPGKGRLVKVISAAAAMSPATSAAAAAMACLSVDGDNHHRYVLQEMTGLMSREALTDLTVHCQGGDVVHAHRRVLQNVSAFVRKASSSSTSDLGTGRTHLVLPVSL